MRLRWSVVWLVGLAAMGCDRSAEEATDMRATGAAIGAVREAFLAAMNTNDLEGILAAIPEDGVAMPPNEPAVVGTVAARRWHQARIDQFTMRIDLTRTDMGSARDWAVEWFRYDVTLIPKAAGDTLHDTGRLMWQWHRQADGAWKIRKAIWNSDQPLPTSAD